MNPALLHLITLFLLGGCLLLTLLLWQRFQTNRTLTREFPHSGAAVRQLLEAAPMAIVNLDASGKILHWNQRASEILGWSESLAIGTSFALLSLPDGQHDRFAELLKAGCAGQTARADLLALNRSGELFEISLVIGPLGRPGHMTGEVVAIIDDIRERKRMEATLRNREETYRNLVEGAPVAIFVHVEGHLVFLNPSAVALFGAATAEQLIGVAIESLLHPEDRARFHTALDQSNDDPLTTNRFSLRIAPLNGSEREVEATFIGVDYSGCNARMAICVDVTEHNRAERELRTQSEFIQTMLDTIPAPIFYKDAQGLYLGCNRAFEAFVGHPRNAVIGKTVYDLAPADLAQTYAQADQELFLRGGTQTYETQVLHADKDRHEVIYSKATFNDREGRCAGLIGALIDITDRKRSEMALRESERKFRAVFDQAYQLTGILDPEGRVLQVNRIALQLAGVRENEVLGRFFWETPWWQGYPQQQEQLRQAVTAAASGETVSFECAHRRPDGGEYTIDFSLKPIRDEEGRIVYLIPEGRDISELKRREETTLLVARGVSAEVGDHFFRSLTRHLAEAMSADLVFIGERHGEKVKVLAGVHRGEAMSEIVYPLAGTPCEMVFTSGKQITYPHSVHSLFPNSCLLTTLEIEGFTGSPLCDSTGVVQGILVALFQQPIRDQPLVENLQQIFAARAAAELQRLQAEEALRRSEASFRKLSHEFETIFNGIPDSLTVWSADRRMVWANRASNDYFELDPTDLTGVHCEQICPYDGCTTEECEIQRCLTSGQQDERIRKTRDGRTWGIKSFPLRNEPGELTGVIRLASDLSERMQLREEATRAAHLAALGELAAGVAHEINNPTGLILLDLPVLRDAFRDARPILEAHLLSNGDFPFAGLKYSQIRDQLPSMLDEVLDGAQRIKHIVEELKDFSRPTDPHQFDLLDLNAVVTKAIGLVGGQLRKLTDHFTVNPAATLPPVRGSVQRLEQVVINLLLNAGQALPDRSRGITVSVLHLQAARRNAIVIQDEGIGIRPEHLQQITDPFFTTRREKGGTGLGLSVSSRIIQEHGGTINFASKPGVGTTVTVELPIAETGDRRH